MEIAANFRQETLATVAWIAERLQMGSRAIVNTFLYLWRWDKNKKQLLIRTAHANGWPSNSVTVTISLAEGTFG